MSNATKILLKFLYLPLAIIACTAAGSIFAEEQNFSYFQTKYNLNTEEVRWFSFALNASVLFALLPSMLYKEYGPRKTLILGAILLTGAHLVSASMLNSTKTYASGSRPDNFTVFMIFSIAVVGGQGACIIFIASLSAMLKFHSVLCTHLLNGLLFTYFLGSDTFHQVFKFGIFSEMSLGNFFILIAICGFIMYIICAIMYNMKDKDKGADPGSLSKGVVFKKGIQLYMIVQAVFLGLAFMMMMTASLQTYWGSRFLCLILGLNLFIPVIMISFAESKEMQKSIANPSDVDKFMMKKGSNADLSSAQQVREFWLILIAFAIIIGIARMTVDNSVIIAQHNSQTGESYMKAFQVFEIFGSFFTGIFLSLFRMYVSPYGVFAIYSFFFIISQVLMFFIQVSGSILLISVILTGFIQGGSFVLIGIISHEDYGTKYVSNIIGYIMTGASFGILIFNGLIFDLFYYLFVTDSTTWQNQKSYGKWTMPIFLICLASSITAFLMSTGAYVATRRNDGNLDKISSFVNL